MADQIPRFVLSAGLVSVLVGVPIDVFDFAVATVGMGNPHYGAVLTCLEVITQKLFVRLHGSIS